MKELAVDTSVYVDYLRGESAARDKLESAVRIALPAAAVGEIMSGFRSAEAGKRDRALYDEFCRVFDVLILPVTEKTAEHYAHIMRWLKSQGTPVPANDIWIAAAALEHGMPLATSDNHYKKIPHVILV
ncbi:MAG: type II toxin-antitoxin system VapC family toxin [Candidatus Omnitrophica bacterium]|nr:type II toxin-antitoxin system VapC family toxin [Candidatus Omnitrophota bacterium]